MVKVFTDTSANLPASLIKKYSLTVIPFSYTVNGVEAEYDQAVNFDGKKFYDAMRSGADIKTSMINTDAFVKAFKKELDEENDIIYIGMSGGISGTFNASRIAAEELKEQYPERKIEVIDTLAASLGEGLQVIRAAQRLFDGATFEETVEYVTKNIDYMCQYFTVDNLSYLKRGGRLSSTAAIVGTVLNIKPILTGNEDGKIVISSKVRGRKQAITALANHYEKLVRNKASTIGIAHADDPDAVKLLLSELKKRGFSGEFVVSCYEPVTGAHVGPGTLALFFFGTHK